MLFGDLANSWDLFGGAPLDIPNRSTYMFSLFSNDLFWKEVSIGCKSILEFVAHDPHFQLSVRFRFLKFGYGF